MKREPLWVVLTGGPCAGKTSVLAALAAYFDGRLSVASEAATQVLGIHATPRPDWTEQQWYAFQYAIARQQLNNEARARYQAYKCGYELVVCDRSLYDNAAYPAGKEVVYTMAAAGQVRPMEAYDVVVHLDSLAVTAPDKYNCLSNAARYETLEEAQAINIRTLDAWAEHPNRVVISNDGTLDETVASVLETVKAELSTRNEGAYAC